MATCRLLAARVMRLCSSAPAGEAALAARAGGVRIERVRVGLRAYLAKLVMFVVVCGLCGCLGNQCFCDGLLFA